MGKFIFVQKYFPTFKRFKERLKLWPEICIRIVLLKSLVLKFVPSKHKNVTPFYDKNIKTPSLN